MLDRITHLKHLQSIVLEYDPTWASNKPIMLKYFWESLKLSILAELKHWDLE